jgi:hypothetical protein
MPASENLHNKRHSSEENPAPLCSAGAPPELCAMQAGVVPVRGHWLSGGNRWIPSPRYARRSILDYEKQAVEGEIISDILWVAAQAPTTRQIRIAEPVQSAGDDIFAASNINGNYLLTPETCCQRGTRLGLANLLNMSGCEHSGTCAMKAPEMLGKRSA